LLDSAAFTDWLPGVGLVFVATAVVAVVAVLQMRKLGDQAQAEAAAVQKQINRLNRTRDGNSRGGTSPAPAGCVRSR
jgi:hypothetical protein